MRSSISLILGGLICGLAISCGVSTPTANSNPSANRVVCSHQTEADGGPAFFAMEDGTIYAAPRPHFGDDPHFIEIASIPGAVAMIEPDRDTTSSEGYWISNNVLWVITEDGEIFNIHVTSYGGDPYLVGDYTIWLVGNFPANDGMRDIGADMTGISEFTKGRMRANSELQRTLDGLSAERKYAEHQLSLSREQLALQERILRQQKEKREEMEKQRAAEPEVSGPQVNAADQRANEEALESELRLHERRRDLLAQGSSLESSLMTEQESRNERQARYNLLLDEGAISLETYTRAMARLGEESVESVEGQSESMDGLTQSQERMGAGFDAVWGSMLDGPEAMGKAMQRLGMQLAGAAIKKMILDKFVGSAATSVKAAEGAAGYHAAYSIIPFAGPGLAAMNIAKMYGDIAAASGIGAAIGAAAEGGYASGMTLVGERGPEIVNFRTPGQVTPNHAIGNMGGGPTINVTIQGDLISDDTSKDNLARDIYERLGQMGAA